MGNKILIKDVAHKAKVSPTLVSLVLNNKADQYGIKRETQERVMAIANRMGYFNTDSSPLPIQTAPGIVGIMVSELDFFALKTAENIYKQLSPKGFALSIVFCNPHLDNYLRLIDSYSIFFSGLIFIGNTTNKGVINKLLNNNYPFVTIGDEKMSSLFNSVYIDNTAIANTILHLIKTHSYSNTLILYSQEEELSSIRSTLKRTLKKELPTEVVELKIDKELSNPNQYNFSALFNLLRPPYRIDVIIVLNCQLIDSLLAALEHHHIRIHHDIEIISTTELGCVNSTHCNNIFYIKYNHEEIAQQSVQTILDEIKNRGKSKRKLQFQATIDITK